MREFVEQLKDEVEPKDILKIVQKLRWGDNIEDINDMEQCAQKQFFTSKTLLD